MGLLVSLQCFALDMKVPDETLSKRIVFEFIPSENRGSGRLVVFIPNLDGFEPEKCEFEDESFEGTLTLGVYETPKGFACSMAYESEGSERHTVKIHYKGTNKIAVGTYTHNKSLK